MSPAQSIPRRGYNIVEKEPSHRTLRRNQNLFKRSIDYVNEIVLAVLTQLERRILI